MPGEIPTIQYVVGILTNEDRIKLLGILATQEYSIEGLASILHMKSSRVSHHLRKLQRVGLVTVRYPHEDIIHLAKIIRFFGKMTGVSSL
jgi:DNA-binding transcriptional ArsR family regulator